MSNIESINNYFKIPIIYNDKVTELEKSIIEDLELNKTIEKEDTPLYHFVCDPKSELSKELLSQITSYYTDDKQYLTQTQSLIKKYKSIPFSSNIDEIKKIFDEIKNDTGFKEKYAYIEWQQWDYLNKSEIFLQIMSIYNLTSPILSLFIPLIILIIPFFIIKMKGLPITINEYLITLKKVSANHSLGKLFTDFNSVDSQGKVYLLVSAAFYIFTIYQNILACRRFYNNLQKVHDYIAQFKNYLKNVIPVIENFYEYSKPYNKYREFNSELSRKLMIIKDFYLKLEVISPYNISIETVKQLGIVLKSFYDIYSDPIYNEAIMYSLGFSAYIEILEGMQYNITEKHMTFAKIINKSNKNSFTDVFYPSLTHKKPVKNNFDFKDKNIIITGPNASGKTTLLKSMLINIIVTQQFGCGFYSSSHFKPYSYIYCYLNIPDTSGRDSLFQSETRKCGDILKQIKASSSKKNHFCVFDELFSGTNPEEATKCGYAFLLYLSKYKNVNFILTTHYLKICEKIQDKNNIKNYQMLVKKEANKPIKYYYKLDKGITKVSGGIEILREMEYPTEIVDSFMNF